MCQTSTNVQIFVFNCNCVLSDGHILQYNNVVGCPECESRTMKTRYYDFNKKRFKESWFRCGSKEITEMGDIKWMVYFNQSEDCKKTILLGEDE